MGTIQKATTTWPQRPSPSKSYGLKKLKITLTEKQDRAIFHALQSRHKNRYLFDGGARSGKTVSVLLWMLMVGKRYHKSHQLVARKHRAHMRTTTWLTMKSLIPANPFFTVIESDMQIRLGNGSMIHFDGLDDKERVDKVLGSEWTNIFINEATQVSFETANTLVTRLAQRAYDNGGREAKRNLVLDCNPKSEQHWLFKVGVRKVNPNTELPLHDSSNWERISWTPYDNPNLPEDFIKSLEALPEVKRKRMLDGKWCGNEGAVYDEFDEDVHCVDQMPKGWEGWPRYVGVDFGYNNPFVWCEYALSPDDVLYMYFEHYQRRMTVQQHYDEVLKARFEALLESQCLEAIISDHDAEDRAQLDLLGIMTQNAFKDIRPGIDKVKERLGVQKNGKPRLRFLHGACPHTVAEFYEYREKAPKEDRNKDENPEKHMDHSMDQLRYVVVSIDGITESILMSDRYA